MASAKMTLIGYDNYDPHFWDGLEVAPGIDKDVLITTILMNGGEFEVLYSNPEFMKLLLPKWSQKWMHTMERWVKLINVDYAPLDNYDRHEEYTDTRQGNNSQTTVNTGSTTDNTTNTFNGTTEGKVSAFDASDYQPHDHTTAGNTSTLNGTVSSTSNGTMNGTDSSTFTHTSYMRGNIGTMSSQEMYLREQEVLKINMYDELANLFLTEFVIAIY